MDRVSSVLGLACLGLVALACKGKTSVEASDAAAIASVTPAPSASAAPAASAGLTRYADEQVPAEVAVTLKAPTTARLAADESSTSVASLKSGDKVVPIALHGDYALVAVGEHADATTRGWIPGQVVIDALKSAGAAPKPSASASAHAGGPSPTADSIERKTTPEGDPIGKCPTGWIGLPGGLCNRPCKSDADCHGKYKCKKLGSDHVCDTHDWN